MTQALFHSFCRSFCRSPHARRSAALHASLVALAALAGPAIALADWIAPLHAHGAVDPATRARAQHALSVAVVGIGHVAVAEESITRAETAAGAAISTSSGLVALGKSTGADWVVSMAVATNAATTLHLELTVCQVASGRVELVSRDVDDVEALDAATAEMLKFVLRPEGMGDDPIPWEVRRVGAATATASASEVASASPVATTTIVAGSSEISWNDGRRFTATAGLGLGYVASRPSRATGSRAVGMWDVTAAYAFATVPEAEIFGRLGGVFGSGGAVHISFGPAYTQPLTSTLGLRLGVGIGGFFTVGKSSDARALLTFAPAFVARVGHGLAVELTPFDFLYAFVGVDPVVVMGVRGAVGGRF